MRPTVPFRRLLRIWDYLFGNATASPPRRVRLGFEPMEDRTMLTAVPLLSPDGGTWVKVDTITVATKTNQTVSTGVQSAVALEAGKPYLAVARGEGRIATDTTGFADAEFIRYNKSTGPQDGSSAGYPWANHGVRLAGVSGGDTTGNLWGPYQADHQYVKTFVGQGTKVTGYYVDAPGYYGDNSGTLAVDLYAEVPTVWVDPSAAVGGVVPVAEGTTATLTVRRAGGDLSKPLTVSLGVRADADGDKAVEWGTNATLTGPGGEPLSAGGAVTFPAGVAELPLTLKTWASVLDGTLADQRSGFELAVLPAAGRYGAGDATRSDRPASLGVHIDARPHPLKQAATTVEGVPVPVTLSALVADGLGVTYELFTPPRAGSVSISGGVATYAPRSGFAGDDEFLVRAFTTVNGVALGSNLGVVRVHVDPTPDDPEPEPDPLPLPNQSPTVWLADRGQWGHAGTPFTLVANVADPDGPGDVVAVEWDLDFDGAQFVPAAGVTGAAPEVTLTEPGYYQVAVRVTDAAGEQAVDVGWLWVMAADDPTPAGALPNDPPPEPSPDEPLPPLPPPPPPPATPVVVASAGQVGAGGSVTFDSGVTGPDADWVQWDFDYDGTHFAPDSWGGTVGRTFVGPGTYVVAAGVYGDDGELTLATTTVTVADAPALVVLPPGDVVGYEGEPVDLPAPVQWLDLFGPPDAPAAVLPGSVRWDFGDGSPPVDGVLAPSHVYQPGQYLARVTLTDSLGNTGSAVVNVWVGQLPPDADAGPDQEVVVGQLVAFAGAAFDHSGIASVEWDFDYDGVDFVPDPAATTLTPAHTFRDSGEYWVALRVVANDGTESFATATVFAANAPPSGTVTLADGQAPDEGSPVYFTVAGLGDTDPADLPAVWADWTGDGSYDLIQPGDWHDVTVGADGLREFQVAHTYDDDRTYTARFWVVDALGEVVESTVAVAVAGVAPSATPRLDDPSGTGRFAPGAPVRLKFGPVTDPSAADRDAGFVYRYRVDGGAVQSSNSPEVALTGFAPGTAHTVTAYVVDKNGLESAPVTLPFRVLSDRAFRVDGAGTSVEITWTNPPAAGGGPTTGTKVLSGGEAYQFDEQITGLSVKLLKGGVGYTLTSNFQIDRVDGAGVAVAMTVSTTSTGGLPESARGFVGTGDIGRVSVGPGSAVDVFSRRNFGGLDADGSGSNTLAFHDLTGPVVADRLGKVVAPTGTVSGLTVKGGVDSITAVLVGDINTRWDQSTPNTPLTITFTREGRFLNDNVALNFGNQPSTLVRLNAAGRPKTVTTGGLISPTTWPDQAGTIVGGTTTEYEYDAQGRVNHVVYTTPPRPEWYYDNSRGWADLRYSYDGMPAGQVLITGTKNWVTLPESLGVPAETGGSGPAGWLSAQWAAVTTNLGNGVEALTRDLAVTVDGAVRTLKATAYQQWTNAAATITWVADQAGKGALYVGGRVVDATREVANKFVDAVQTYGGQVVQLWDKLSGMLGQYQDKASALFTAFVNDPVKVAENLLGTVNRSLTGFFNGLAGAGQTAVLDWLFGDLKESFKNFPTDFSKLPEVGKWLVNDFFGLTWDNVQGLLVGSIGAGNVALLGEVFDRVGAAAETGSVEGLLGWLKANDAELDVKKIAEDALAKAAAEVGKLLVPPALAVVGDLTTLGAGRALTSLYNTATWLVDNLKTFENLGQVVDKVAMRIDLIAKGDQAATDATVNDVLQFLNTQALPAALRFAVKQCNLGGVPAAIRKVVEQVKATPLGLLEKAITKVVGVAKEALAKANRPVQPGEIMATTLILPDGRTAHLWVVKQNGPVQVLWATSDGKKGEIKTLDDVLPPEAKSAQPQLYQKLVALFATVMAEADKAAKAMAEAEKAAKAVAGQPAAGQAGATTAANKAVAAALRDLRRDLKAELQSLVDIDATCYFGKACFAAGTPIRTPGGWQPIEDLRVGDRVLSRNQFDPAGANEWKVVEEVFRRVASVWHLTAGGRLIRTSGEHPFFARSKGWVATRELVAGDELLCEDGTWAAVEEALDTGRWEPVYNVRVADHHTYFVGEEGWGFAVWAHNAYFYHLPGADTTLAQLGQTYTLVAQQAFAALPRLHRKATIAVSQANVDGALKYVITVYGTDVAFAEVETYAHSIGAVAYHAQGVHAERHLYNLFASNPGFTRAIGISNYNGPCDTCEPFFVNQMHFKNIWWPAGKSL